MKKLKNFDINVPELGDVPDITQVSNGISGVEEALAGSIERMRATITGTKLELVSDSRTTQRSRYYNGMSIIFEATSSIQPGVLKTVTVDTLPEQPLNIAHVVTSGDSCELVYDGVRFNSKVYSVPRSNEVNSSSEFTVATSRAVKIAHDKSVDVANSKVSKSGDTMTGKLEMKVNPEVNNSYPGIDFTHTDGTYNAIGNFEGDGTIMVHTGTQKGIVYTTGFKPTPKDIGAVNVNDVHNTESPNNNIFGKIPKVGEDGVMEIGRYLDFHYNKEDTADYTARISVDESGWFNFVDGGLLSEKGIKTNNKNTCGWQDDIASFYSNAVSQGWDGALGKLTEGRFELSPGSEWIRYGTGHLNDNFVIYTIGQSGADPLKLWYFRRGTGDFTSSGNVIAYSDIKLKKDLEVIPNAIDKIQSISGYTYTRKDTGARQTGLVAQEVQNVLPEAVTVQTDDKGEETLGVAYGNLVGLLVEGIKELKAEIEELKKRVV